MGSFIDISVDVEADGPTPVMYSMLEIGAQVVGRKDSFHCYLAPRPALMYDPNALKAIGCTREQTLAYPVWTQGIELFRNWLNALKGDDNRLVFWSDNPGFDWQFVNAYLHLVEGSNPFGFSSRRIGDLYAGLMGDKNKHTQWKKFRKTKHTHNALDDAKGNAEALAHILSLSNRNDYE